MPPSLGPRSEPTGTVPDDGEETDAPVAAEPVAEAPAKPAKPAKRSPGPDLARMLGPRPEPKFTEDGDVDGAGDPDGEGLAAPVPPNAPIAAPVAAPIAAVTAEPLGDDAYDDDEYEDDDEPEESPPSNVIVAIPGEPKPGQLLRRINCIEQAISAISEHLNQQTQLLGSVADSVCITGSAAEEIASHVASEVVEQVARRVDGLDRELAAMLGRMGEQSQLLEAIVNLLQRQLAPDVAAPAHGSAGGTAKTVVQLKPLLRARPRTERQIRQEAGEEIDRRLREAMAKINDIAKDRTSRKG